jgi:hypothetical protein
MRTYHNNSVLAALLKCKIGTIKEAEINSSDQILRTIIQHLRLQGNQHLQGWVQDDLFIYKNEQRPLEVFAHFLDPSSGLLITVNGCSTIYRRDAGGAELCIDIHSLNYLQR